MDSRDQEIPGPRPGKKIYRHPAPARQVSDPAPAGPAWDPIPAQPVRDRKPEAQAHQVPFYAKPVQDQVPAGPDRNPGFRAPVRKPEPAKPAGSPEPERPVSYPERHKPDWNPISEWPGWEPEPGEPGWKPETDDSNRVQESDDPDFQDSRDTEETGPPGRAKKQKKRGKRRVGPLSVCFVTLMIGVLCFSLFKLARIVADYRKAEKEYGSIAIEAITDDADSGYKTINYALLLDTNPDFLAWIDIPGTKISYPVVRSRDNADYLRTTFLGESATAGSIFTDYRCPNPFSDKITVVYGHRMNDDTMFSQLKKFLTESFWKDNQEIHIYTRDGIGIYRIFAACTVQAEDAALYNYMIGNSEEAYLEWTRYVASLSRYATGVVPTGETHAILLSTCVYQQEDVRNVVAAVCERTVENP